MSSMKTQTQTFLLSSIITGCAAVQGRAAQGTAATIAPQAEADSISTNHHCPCEQPFRASRGSNFTYFENKCTPLRVQKNLSVRQQTFQKAFNHHHHTRDAQALARKLPSCDANASVVQKKVPCGEDTCPLCALGPACRCDAQPTYCFDFKSCTSPAPTIRRVEAEAVRISTSSSPRAGQIAGCGDCCCCGCCSIAQAPISINRRESVSLPKRTYAPSPIQYVGSWSDSCYQCSGAANRMEGGVQDLGAYEVQEVREGPFALRGVWHRAEDCGQQDQQAKLPADDRHRTLLVKDEENGDGEKPKAPTPEKF